MLDAMADAIAEELAGADEETAADLRRQLDMLDWLADGAD